MKKNIYLSYKIVIKTIMYKAHVFIITFLLFSANCLLGQGLVKNGEYVFDIHDTLGIEMPVVICHYTNDTLNGLFLIKDKYEITRYKTHFTKGKLDGYEKKFSKSGKLIRLSYYSKDSLIFFMTFSNSGKRSIEYWNKIGDTNKKMELIYRRNGNLLSKYEYEGNRLTKRTSYYRSGRIKFYIVYNDEEKAVRMIFLNRNGTHNKKKGFGFDK